MFVYATQFRAAREVKHNARRQKLLEQFSRRTLDGASEA